MSREEKWNKLIQIAKKIKEKITLSTLSTSDVDEFCKAWMEWYETLPSEEKEMAIASFKFGVVKYSEVLEKVRKDFEFFKFLIEVLAEE